MARHLPSLNAVRAFEAAARHLSFTKAGEELHVTQAAISHQVKSLEDQLGLLLFRRLNRRLLLTDAGQAYLSPLTGALDQIAVATSRLSQTPSTPALRVSVLASMAAKWLLPRLSRFRSLHPEIDVLISASAGRTEFDNDDVDVAIRYGPGRAYPGLEIIPMMGDRVFPVCSPTLLTSGAALRRPQDLANHTLLHDQTVEGEIQHWGRWLIRAGVGGIDTSRGPGFSDSNLALDAAAAGQGVALTRWSLAAIDLAAGRLVVPFGPVIDTDFSYFIVYPKAKADLPKVLAFANWLLEEVGAEDDTAELSVLSPR